MERIDDGYCTKVYGSKVEGPGVRGKPWVK